MKRFLITAYPYATQFGRLDIPEEIADDKDAVSDYIKDHFDEVYFSEPELSYWDADFEFEEDDDE